jgi:hypothetical protein
MLRAAEKGRSPRKGDALLRALELLSQALAAQAAGREQAWVSGTADALAQVEQGLRQHLAAAAVPDGPLPEVDQTRPGLVRRSEEVNHEEEELLQQVVALRQELQSAAPAAIGPDLAAVRQRAERIAADLRQLQEAETDLILESVNTDIGAGD